MVDNAIIVLGDSRTPAEERLPLSSPVPGGLCPVTSTQCLQVCS